MRSVRARATAVAVVVVSAALAVGSIGLLHLLRDSLRGSLTDTARLEASGVAALVRRGLTTGSLPAPHGDGVTQLVDPGRRVAASSVARPQPPVSGLRPRPGRSLVAEVAGIPVEDETGLEAARDDDRSSYLVVASGLPAPHAGWTVYVAVSLAAAESSTGTVALALIAGLPVLVGLVGATVWLLTGRSLQPVEGIRAQVADMSARDLHRRVPVPPTGDEVARLARTMNELLDRLERASDRQRQFVSDASHELRSPLTSIRTTLEVASAAPAADWPATAGDLLDETARMQRIVDDLLLLARADEGTLTGRRQTVDLDDVVLDEARRLRARGRVAVDIRRVSAGRVNGDADQLARVVRNLADNAERHATSAVAFEVDRDGPDVRVVVSDDGPGIAPADRERVFQRFARLDQGRGRDGGGAGLGLSIVRELVGAHGGTVAVSGGPATPAGGGAAGPARGDGGAALTGARFEVVLPAAADGGPGIDPGGVGTDAGRPDAAINR